MNEQHKDEKNFHFSMKSSSLFERNWGRFFPLNNMTSSFFFLFEAVAQYFISSGKKWP